MKKNLFDKKKIGGRGWPTGYQLNIFLNQKILVFNVQNRNLPKKFLNVAFFYELFKGESEWRLLNVELI